MSPRTAIALVLALVSTSLINIAYLREHEAAVALPTLTLRRPLESLRLLLGDRGWMIGFAMETGGWLLYAAALALASLALVQSVAAGGIGLLAFASARLTGRPLGSRAAVGVGVAVIGLLALAISLAGGGAHGDSGSTVAILLWLAATGALALVFVAARRRLGVAVGYAIAGGLCFSVGDIATKVVTQGGSRLAFAVALITGYALGTALLQLGYQSGAALTVAGIATLLTNGLPIAAGTFLLHERVPRGALGALRVAAYAAVVLGALLLARGDPGVDGGQAPPEP